MSVGCGKGVRTVIDAVRAGQVHLGFLRLRILHVSGVWHRPEPENRYPERSRLPLPCHLLHFPGALVAGVPTPSLPVKARMRAAATLLRAALDGHRSGQPHVPYCGAACAGLAVR